MTQALVREALAQNYDVRIAAAATAPCQLAGSFASRLAACLKTSHAAKP